jgi:hypothetical protein
MENYQTGKPARMSWSTPRISDFTSNRPQYEAWAARARRQADEATTETARTIHLGIAEEYERKVAGG